MSSFVIVHLPMSELAAYNEHNCIIYIPAKALVYFSPETKIKHIGDKIVFVKWSGTNKLLKG